MKNFIGVVGIAVMSSFFLQAVEIRGLAAQELFDLIPSPVKHDVTMGQVSIKTLGRAGECRQSVSIHDATAKESMVYACNFLAISLSDNESFSIYKHMLERRLPTSIKSLSHAAITIVEGKSIRCQENALYGGKTTHRCVFKLL